MPLVSYIRNSLRFWCYASFSTSYQNHEKKIGVTDKICEKARVKLLRDLTEKVSILVLWQLPTLGFCYVLSKRLMKEMNPTSEKKFTITEEKLRKLQLFEETILKMKQS